MVDPNQHDRFILRQRVRLVINQYQFSIPDGAGDGEPFCFVEQRRFKFKEDIGFFTDETKTTELMRIKARQRFDPRATYDITTPTGDVIGTIQKVFGASLLRSTFVLRANAGGLEVTARERSLPVALFRRLIGFVPYVGGYSDWLPIAYDFEYTASDGTDLGVNRRRRWQWRDIYEMDLSADTERLLDRRLALASAVGMDALMAR